MTKYEKLQENLKSNQSIWLVTGVAGFIGSNLLEKLLKEYDVPPQSIIGLSPFLSNNQ